MYSFHEFFQTISLCRLQQPRVLIPPVVVQSSHSVGKLKLAPIEIELVIKGRKIQILPKRVMILSGVVSGEWGVKEPRELFLVSQNPAMNERRGFRTSGRSHSNL